MEMLQLLEAQEKKSALTSRKRRGRFMDNWIHTTTKEYLHRTPVRKQTPDAVRKFLLELKSLPNSDIFKRLTKADKLQLINIQPLGESTLYAIIDDYEARFTDGDTEIIQELIQKHFGRPETDFSSGFVVEEDSVVPENETPLNNDTSAQTSEATTS